MRMFVLAIAAACLFLSSTYAMTSERILVDDFRSNPETKWRFFADTVMGGVSSGRLEFKNKDGVSYARLSGDVSTANNGGFIQMRRTLGVKPAAAIKGVRLFVRGNNQNYFVHLRTSGTILPWQYYQASFPTSSDWREIRIPLSDFKRSSRMLIGTLRATSVKSIAIVAFGRNHKADVEVREIELF